jgi:deoxyribose-phosphate aldolase
MEFDQHISEYVKASPEEKIFTQKELKKMVAVIDLTTLNPNDDIATIKKLCEKATSPLGSVAAVCVFPRFVSIASQCLKGSIPIASVANFPTGSEKLAITLADIVQAVASGASEMDVVMPYHLYKGGEKKAAWQYIEECKKACGKTLLKVILEISEFENLEDIYVLSKEVIATGVDFIKTSTGKSKHGATLAAASAMLLAIKASKSNVGFKASGGIKTLTQAYSYIELAGKIMGDNWITARYFRIGASGLLDAIT